MVPGLWRLFNFKTSTHSITRFRNRQRKYCGGKFVVRATSAGTCNISVSAKTKDGVKAQGPPLKFRVKKIPDPSAKLGGQLCQGIMTFSKNQLAAIGGVGAEIPGFDFDVVCNGAGLCSCTKSGSVVGTCGIQRERE